MGNGRDADYDNGESVCVGGMMRALMCVRTISAQKQRAEAGMMFDVLSVGDGRKCAVIFLLKQQQQTFQHYKVSKVELDPSLHFHPSLTQLTSRPYLPLSSFTLVSPNTYSFHLLPGILSQFPWTT